MNIFYLHQLPLIAAQYHCDKHVGKMLIESCQLLATAHHHFGNGHKVSYRPTHANHPSAIWVRQSRLNYQWLSDLASGLGRQFFWRYGHDHKSRGVWFRELMYAPPAMMDLPLRWTPPTLAMPDEYKSDDHLASYRKYYASKAATMPLVYNKGRSPQPHWLQDLLLEEAMV
jgi:hypothetical protein